MTRMSFFKKIMNDKVGGTAIEYGLIAAFIVIGSMGAIQALGDEDANIWNFVSEEAKKAMGN